MAEFKSPAIGDALWYVPSEVYPRGPGHRLEITDRAPQAATVSRVFTDRLVNLNVTDEKGEEHPVGFVTLVQPGDPNPQAHMGHCEWEKPDGATPAPS